MPRADQRSRIDRDYIIAALSAHAEEFRALGITHMWLFGSFARGEARADSDVDLAVDIDDDRPVTLFDLGEAASIAEDLLGRQVDLLTIRSASGVLGSEIAAARIRVI